MAEPDDFKLIREIVAGGLFEWKFGGKGVEVKVFRLSRDHGVDAVMYDPDPLRGGKYVLQQSATRAQLTWLRCETFTVLS